MNKRRLVCIGCFVLWVLLLTLSAETGLDPSLVALWHMDEGYGVVIYDATPNNNDGIIHGAVWTEGICGKALKFDGINAHVKLEIPIIGDLDEWTLIAWVNVAEGDIFSWDNDKGHIHTIYGEYTYRAQTKNFIILHGNEEDGTWIWYPLFDNYPPSGGSLPLDELKTKAPVYQNEWYHVAFSKMGNSICFWYQGGFVGCYPYEHYASGTAPTEVWLGKRDLYSNWEDYVLHGILDEIAIYNRALTEDEIKAHYESGLGCLPVKATVDIYPNTLNLKSKGKWVTCYIELPEGYDVNDINVETIELTEINNQELAEPIPAENWPMEIGDYDKDGTFDLMVKFDRVSLINLLKLFDFKDEVELIINGKLVDGILFGSSDTIRVKN